MKYILFVLCFFVLPYSARTQHTLVIQLQDSKSKELLAGATIRIAPLNTGTVTDANGLAIIPSIPDGTYIFTYSYTGYISRIDTLTFPRTNDTIHILLVQDEDKELEEVIVSTTRSSRSIEDIPTRIEVIAGEELDEKANMKPGDIRMMLSESTGIQTQQTSATSANASIRIQGLDGRYTQLLKDGFPVYSGAASGLGLLQTPPLDLQQVEVIKGAASTLYGGGAIAGLVNLVSKTPHHERELRFLVNGTSAGGLDINGFYGKRNDKVGFTLFAAYNRNAPYDPAGIDLTAIPKFERYTFNPKLFLYLSKRTDFSLGVNANFENRIGGDLHYIRNEGDSLHSYYERNKTQRISTQGTLNHRFNDHQTLTLKNSYSYFNRIIDIPGYTFNGTQHSTFTELSYATHKEDQMYWVGGANLLTDGLTEKKLTAFPVRDYRQTTMGAFVQNTWQATKEFSVETGLRGDYVVDWGFALLPRLSLQYKFNKHITSRFGGGFGYKAPTIFTEESERIQYRNVLPVSSGRNRLERSVGGNWDINYRTSFADGKITFSINQLFYYTHLNSPLLLVPVGSQFEFQNSDAHIDSKGGETNIKIGYKDFKLFLGYTYTDAVIHNNNIKTQNPLTPKHKVNAVLFYELEDKWKIGLEAYYFSPQLLSDGRTGRDYWLCGFMAEKLWERWSVYINFENFLDARQTRFDTIYTGTPTNPVFRDIYAPLDGFVVNGGVKIRL